jgi:hypothetical protein
MHDKMPATTTSVDGSHIQTGVDPLFLSISKKQANFLIWRVEARDFFFFVLIHNLVGHLLNWMGEWINPKEIFLRVD